MKPYRVPVLIVTVLHVWFPILTDRGLPVRKFRTKLQRGLCVSSVDLFEECPECPVSSGCSSG